MRIGEAAEAAGVPTQTIRFYERRGLLPPAPRGPNGYREYDDSVLAPLAFIRSAQAAGLTLVEVASILEMRREGATPCSHVTSLLSIKLDELRARRRELDALEAELEGLIRRSARLDPADCNDAQICHIIGGDAAAGGRGPGKA